jgi:hypothetical protein
MTTIDGSDVLTPTVLEALWDLNEAVAKNSHIRWLSGGGETVEATARAFTDKNGNFLLPTEDVRDGYLWTSGIFEHFIPIRTVLAKMAEGVFAIDTQ